MPTETFTPPPATPLVSRLRGDVVGHPCTDTNGLAARSQESTMSDYYGYTTCPCDGDTYCVNCDDAGHTTCGCCGTVLVDGNCANCDRLAREDYEAQVTFNYARSQGCSLAYADYLATDWHPGIEQVDADHAEAIEIDRDRMFRASASAVLHHLAYAYGESIRDIRVHDATTDLLGDGETWVITGDAPHLGEWAMLDSVHDAARSVPGVLAEPYDGCSLVLYPADTLNDDYDYGDDYEEEFVQRHGC